MPLCVTVTLGGNRREVPRQNHSAYISVQRPRWLHPWDVTSLPSCRESCGPLARNPRIALRWRCGPKSIRIVEA